MADWNLDGVLFTVHVGILTIELNHSFLSAKAACARIFSFSLTHGVGESVDVMLALIIVGLKWL